MSLAAVYSRAMVGIEAPQIVVEVLLSGGLPGIAIIGLPEAAVREAKDRVRGALISAGYKLPQRKVTVNLAPADLPKSGARLDLPIALGILAASGQIETDRLTEVEWLGELALDGSVRAVRGVLSAAREAKAAGRMLVLPAENMEEAAQVSGLSLYPVESLQVLVADLLEGALQGVVAEPVSIDHVETVATPDLAEVKGQAVARRALELTAAGGHNLLMSGPPGTGKTLLASVLPSILPPMSDDEALESATIYSLNEAHFEQGEWGRRKFRAPHHTASAVALVGGGSNPRPGEISLAHHGVLFLDELPEFSRQVLEVLREPLESGRITISRAAAQLEFPAQFQLVAAMNPCPCGYHGDPAGDCRCTEEQIQRYKGKISGPLLDRIDLQVEVARIPSQQLAAAQNKDVESSATVQQRVVEARALQLSRQGVPNSRLQGKVLEEICSLSDEGRQLMVQAIESLGLSGRAYHRVLRVARTIADLAGEASIGIDHLAEALSFRKLDRK